MEEHIPMITTTGWIFTKAFRITDLEQLIEFDIALDMTLMESYSPDEFENIKITFVTLKSGTTYSIDIEYEKFKAIHLQMLSYTNIVPIAFTSIKPSAS